MADIRVSLGRPVLGSWGLPRSHGGRSPPSRAPARGKRGSRGVGHCPIDLSEPW